MVTCTNTSVVGMLLSDFILITDFILYHVCVQVYGGRCSRRMSVYKSESWM